MVSQRLVSGKMVAALAICVSALSSFSHSAFALEDTVNPELFDKMEYRFIGPYRGGRSVAVTGVEGNTNLYFMGTAGGGVWKTENAGLSWKAISEYRNQIDFSGGMCNSFAQDISGFVNHGE